MSITKPISGSQSGCAACGEVFATLTDFDKHHDVDYNRTPAVVCKPPATVGLELSNGAWGTPEGNATRARKSRQMTSMNQSR